MLTSSFQPRDFGVELSRAEFIDLLVADLCAEFGALWMVEELLFRPDVAKKFCKEFRRKRGFTSVPDDFILRSLMQRKRGLW
jgi:hypothetical protein